MASKIHASFHAPAARIVQLKTSIKVPTMHTVDFGKKVSPTVKGVMPKLKPTTIKKSSVTGRAYDFRRPGSVYG